MMPNRFLPSACAVAALLAAGCTPTIDVAIDSYAEPGAHAPGKYVMAPGNTGTADSDLRFKAFAGELEPVLAAKGWTRVADRKDAALLVKLAYSVSGPYTDVTEFGSPQYGITGYAVSTSTVPGPNGTLVSRATPVPVYGTVGYNTNYSYRDRYITSVVVEAYDLGKNADNPPQIWKTTASGSDSTGDARSLMPLLFKSVAPYMGTDTRGQKRIEIKDTRSDDGTR